MLTLYSMYSKFNYLQHLPDVLHMEINYKFCILIWTFSLDTNKLSRLNLIIYVPVDIVLLPNKRNQMYIGLILIRQVNNQLMTACSNVCTYVLAFNEQLFLLTLTSSRHFLYVFHCFNLSLQWMFAFCSIIYTYTLYLTAVTL